MPDRTIKVEIVGDASSLERAFRSSANAGKRWSASFGTFVKGALVFEGVRAGIDGVSDALRGSLGGFSSFQHTLSQTVGLAGDTRKQTAEMSKELLKLGPQVGKSPQELGEALYFVASAGIAASHQMEVVEASAKAAAAGLGETASVADAITSAMNAYGAANLSAAEATDVLVNTVKFGKGEAAAFAPVIGNVAAIASQLGVSFEEVGAALAAQTRLGISAETAAIQLQATFSSLLKETPKTAKAFASVGLTFAGLRKELKEQGLLAVLSTLKQSFGDNTAAMAQAFPNIRALRGLLALVGKNADDARKVFDNMRDSTGALGSAFGAVSKDEAFKFQQTMASLKAAGIQLGAIFAPVASLIADGANKALGAFNDFLAKFSKARTARAKLNVVFDAGRSLFDQGVRLADQVGHEVSRALAAIDWRAAGKAVGDGLSKALGAISDFISQVDWSRVGQAVVRGISDFLKGVDWVTVLKTTAVLIVKAILALDKLLFAASKELGRQIVLGIVAGAAALSGLVETQMRQFPRHLADAAGAFLQVGKDLGKKVIDGVGQGIENARNFVLRKLLEFVNKILGITGFLGRFDPFKGTREKVQARLKEMEADTRQSTGRIQGSINAIHGKDVQVGVSERGVREVQATIDDINVKKVTSDFDALSKRLSGIKKVPVNVVTSGLEELQRNLKNVKGKSVEVSILEKGIANLQTKLGHVKGKNVTVSFIAKGLSEIQRGIDAIKGKNVLITISTKIQQATNIDAFPPDRDRGFTGADAKRQTNRAVAEAERVANEQKKGAAAAAKAAAAAAAAVKVAATAAQKAREQATTAFENLVAAISLKIDRAAVRSGLRDDLAANRELQDAIRARIKAIGHTTDLDRQLFEAQQARNALLAKQRQGAQFRALGLTAEGQQPVASVAALTKRLGSLKAQIKGTVLDTPKTQAELARIGKVLAGKFGKVGSDVRQAILDMFAKISGGLKDGSSSTTKALTKTSSLNTKKVIQGLGLTPEQTKAIRGRLSGFNTSGQALGPAPTVAVAGGFVGPVIVESHVSVELNGEKVGSSVTRQQQKARRRNPPQKRGPGRGGQ